MNNEEIRKAFDEYSIIASDNAEEMDFDSLADKQEYLDAFKEGAAFAHEHQQKRIDELEKKLHEQITHVGFTNGLQLKYGKDDAGLFYPDSDHNTIIPLYMLNTHWHRIESTSGGTVTFEDIKEQTK